MKKREWVYIQPPNTYEIQCDLCGGVNIAWSEFEHMIWCYFCEKDTKGSVGIFGGPIPIEACEMLGISLDKIDLNTGKRLYLKVREKDVVWEEKK